MLFYVTLFLLCFAVSTMVLLVFGALSALRNGAQRADLPYSKRPQDEVPAQQLTTNIDKLATPWGWSGGKTHRKETLAKGGLAPAASAPGGSGGLRRVGWPYREEPRDDLARPGSLNLGILTLGLERLSDLSHKPVSANPERQYKLTRKSTANASSNGRNIAKPWGW